MAKRHQKRQYPHLRRNPYATTDYAMRGMVDMSKMAVFGTVTAGTIGVVGGLFKK